MYAIKLVQYHESAVVCVYAVKLVQCHKSAVVCVYAIKLVQCHKSSVVCVYSVKLVHTSAVVCVSPAMCTPGCQHGGVCTSPGKCRCPRNFTGSHCESREYAATRLSLHSPHIKDNNTLEQYQQNKTKQTKKWEREASTLSDLVIASPVCYLVVVLTGKKS